MISEMSACVLLITFITAGVTCESSNGKFPLKDCETDDVDMLALLNYSKDETLQGQRYLIEYMIRSIARRLKQTQWMVATVSDLFIASNANVDVSDWNFGTFKNIPHYYPKWDPVSTETEVTDITTVLKYKIQIVERLFTQMTRVRNTPTHVGVIFLDGTNSTNEEINNASLLVQETETHVKIFVVIVSDKLEEEVVYLTDTIVVPKEHMDNFNVQILMAICKVCPDRWPSLEHTSGITGTSCYWLHGVRDMGWTDSMTFCEKYYHGNLAGINTEEEYQFLRNHADLLMTKFNESSAQVYIGLHRDENNYAKRFQWRTITQRYHPLLINHWLPDKPSKGCIDKNCGVWQFTRQQAHGPNGSIFCDGWEDVNCFSAVASYMLCEIFIPQKIHVKVLNTVTYNSLERFRSISKNTSFVIYRGNVVSVSENVANQEFVQFLKDSNIDFPMFDCGEDAGYPRHISYSRVCDFLDHCSNRRDEISCFNPHELKTTKGYCSSGQMLHSFQGECDNVMDCKDKSDEVNCFRHPCNSFRCIDGSCLPPQYINDGEIDCLTWNVTWNDSPHVNLTDESVSGLPGYSQCALICNYDQCIKASQLNNSVRDCTGPEGPLDETIGKLEPANTCNHTSGDVVWAPKCTYIKDRYGGIIGCRNMSHVKDCDNYTCVQGYVKCHNSYCIPQHYLLDGKDDCPTGEDEQPLYIGPCIGNFACRDSKVCLHPDNVCDGHPDCPHNDDELDCLLDCPEGFRCVAGTVIVSDYNKSVPLNMNQLSSLDRRTRYLDISGVHIFDFDKFVTKHKEIVSNITVLIMANCRINKLNSSGSTSTTNKEWSQPFLTEKLDISHNMLEEIFSDSGYTYIYKNINYLNVSYNRQLKLIKNFQFSFLEILDLSYTGLVYLNDSAFVELPMLRHLNLSHTLISDFNGRYFPRQLTLQTLDLRSIPTDYFPNYSFHGLTISHSLYTDHFQICCPQILGLHIELRVCVSPGNKDLISSCFHLLELKVQRVLLWILAVLAVLGNITVIVFRIIWDRSVLETGYGLFVTNLGIADFIMGVYLFIIAGADYFYRDNYVLFDKTWRKSLVCKVAGFTATLSCEASTLFVFLITLERFLVMKFPFGNVKCSMYTKIIAVVLSWLESIVLSLLPIVFNLDIYSSNAMCLGLPLKNKVNGWEYSVGVFLIHNFILFLLIAYGQYATFRAMSDNRVSKTTAGMSRTRRVQEITVAKQLSLVVISNFLFWFPVGLIGLMSLIGYEVSDEAYAWITVILLPINSAANPVLYTIPAVMARWKQFKHGVQTT